MGCTPCPNASDFAAGEPLHRDDDVDDVCLRMLNAAAHCQAEGHHHLIGFTLILQKLIDPWLGVSRTEFDGYSDDETVKVVMTGNQEPKFVDITDEAMENSSDVSPCSDVLHLSTAGSVVQTACNPHTYGRTLDDLR